MGRAHIERDGDEVIVENPKSEDVIQVEEEDRKVAARDELRRAEVPRVRPDPTLVFVSTMRTSPEILKVIAPPKGSIPRLR